MEKRELYLFNSMTKQKELFRPIVDGKVGMYVCGVTPYDYSHIGHARAYVAFDVLYRYLKQLGYEVKYVRNFTDIDDKIIKRANDSGKDPVDLSHEFSIEFLKDMDELQCLHPTHEPRVSNHIDQIKDMITKILGNERAYVLDGDVYYSVDNCPEYGRLSGRKLEDNRAGGGGRVLVERQKRNPADFALWKKAKEGEPSWDSPWGPGRPGWHIECSAMSEHYLSPKFDIHGGGRDLIFPHHENEVAQSSAACLESNVNYWMHNGFVNKDNLKMSKSDNNFFTVRDITRTYHPLALRFFLMRTHYRADVNYSDSQLDTASDRVFYIYQTLYDCGQALHPFREVSRNNRIPADIQKLIEEFHEVFLNSMSDDLHTTAVLDDLVDLLKAINSNLKKIKGKKPPQPVIQSLIALEAEVNDVLGILGLLDSSTHVQVLQQLKDKALLRAGLTEEEVQQFIKERAEARKNKDYKTSDKIREELCAKGISLMDEPNGTIWRPCELTQPEVNATELAEKQPKLNVTEKKENQSKVSSTGITGRQSEVNVTVKTEKQPKVSSTGITGRQSEVNVTVKTEKQPEVSSTELPDKQLETNISGKKEEVPMIHSVGNTEKEPEVNAAVLKEKQPEVDATSGFGNGQRSETANGVL